MYEIMKHFFLAGVLIGFLFGCGDNDHTTRDIIRDNVTVEVNVECDTDIEDEDKDKKDKGVAKGG